MAHDQIEIGNGGAEDLDEITAIESESFASPWSKELFAQELVNPISVIFVVRLNSCGRKNIVGYIVCWLVADELHIQRIAVRSDLRKRGIASLLLHEAITFSSKVNISKATLEVRSSNVAAIKFYEKFGFSAKGVRTGYYSDPLEDALIMWADISSVPKNHLNRP
jgi:[ribosomal protein S18]-alanine N-acetyltransferase